MADPTPELTEEMVRNVILTWYKGTNDHYPVEQLEMLLSPDVEMYYPNRSEPFVGLQAFREWYADVLSKYFDETHVVESWTISVEGSRASALVIVRWETRSWVVGAAHSTYRAYLSRQKFHLVRLGTGQTQIKAKIAETFESTAPVYGIGA